MASDTRPIRVLHVDDATDVAATTAELLAREDDRLEVTVAADAEAGLEALETGDFHCVVSDYDMPGRDGIAFLEAVRADRPDLPFILFTGEGSESIASDAISAGVTDYLQKGEADQFALLANRVVNAVEQRRAERAVAKTERRLRELSENTNDVLWMFDADWSELLFVNSAYEDIWGRPIEALREDARDFLEGVHPEDRERVEEAMAALSAGREVDLEYRVNAEEDFGRTVWVQGRPVLEDGEVVRVVGFARDVTDRVARERRFRTLHEVADELSACEAPEEVYELLVAGAEDVLAYDLVIADAVEGDQLVPQAVASPVNEAGYYDATPVDADDNLAARAARTGESSLVDDLREADIDPADDTYRSALTVPIGDHGVFQAVSREPAAFEASDLELVETLVSHGATTLDRLDRERSLRDRTAQLERQNERLEAFASLLSHDLRNPLNVARGRLELAGDDPDPGDLEAIDEALGRMEGLITDLLALAREDDPVPELAPLALDELADEAWRAAVIDGAQLRVETSATVLADEARLRRLLENLFRNAVEHGGDGVTVTVGRGEDGFFVEDDGRGIAPADRERVFESGFSSKEAGTGFGLRIAEQIAADHGWNLQAATGREGGARFELTGVEFD